MFIEVNTFDMRLSKRMIRNSDGGIHYEVNEDPTVFTKRELIRKDGILTVNEATEAMKDRFRNEHLNCVITIQSLDGKTVNIPVLDTYDEIAEKLNGNYLPLIPLPKETESV